PRWTRNACHDDWPTRAPRAPTSTPFPYTTLFRSEIEREVQGKSKKAPLYEKVLAHFLKKRGVRSVVVPANFALGYAKELVANKIDRKSTRLNSSHVATSYAVFCLKKKKPDEGGGR